jgi:adenosylhomocysteine nucleosidase
MTILVCFAVRQEAQFFNPVSVGTHQVRVCITGMGQTNTEAAVHDALQDYSPDLVLTCGFAGGLNPTLVPGSIIFDADQHAGLDAVLLSLRAKPVKLHCAARIASTASEKERLWRQTGADAIEMESTFIREMCRERQIPSATIRVILDAANEDLPLDFNRLMNRNYQIEYGKLIGRVLGSPGKILPLIAFQRQTLMAARRLGTVLEELLKKYPA